MARKPFSSRQQRQRAIAPEMIADEGEGQDTAAGSDNPDTAAVPAAPGPLGEQCKKHGCTLDADGGCPYCRDQKPFTWGQVQRNVNAASGRGLVCRNCGCRHFLTPHTWNLSEGTIRRERVCRNCGRRRITYEK